MVMIRIAQLVALSTVSAGVCAAATLFSGADVGNATAVGSVTTTAANNFIASLSGFNGATDIDTLETILLGTITGSLGTANGVSITAACTGCDNTVSGIVNTGDAQNGYDTTPLGTNYYRVAGAETGVPLTSQTSTFTLTFGSGIQAFGLFLTDIQAAIGTTTVTFNDGSAESFVLPTSSLATGCPSACAPGGSQFFGFTTTGVVNSITFTTVQTQPGGQLSARDVFGVDDLIIGDVSGVPEPATFSLIGLALAGMGAVRLRRRS